MESPFLDSSVCSAREFDFVEAFENFIPEEAEMYCWQKKPGVSRSYLVYRWCQFLLHFLFATMSIFEIGRWYIPDYFAAIDAPRSTKYYLKWLLYLTHWGLLVNVIQSAVAVWVVQRGFEVRNRSNQLENQESNGSYPKLVNLYCILYVVAIHLSTYITLGFWLMVYEPQTCAVDYVTLSEHGFGTVLLLVDLFVARIPYKLAYGFYTSILSLMYVLLTFVHHLMGGTDRFQDKPYIYDRCNWKYPITVIANYIISLFMLTSFHLTLWTLYLVRRRISELIRSENGTRWPTD